MSVPPHPVRSEESVSRPWRAVPLWILLAMTLLTGLVLAVRHGGSAPYLLDVVSR